MALIPWREEQGQGQEAESPRQPGWVLALSRPGGKGSRIHAPEIGSHRGAFPETISGGRKGNPTNKARVGVMCGETRGSSLLPKEQGFWTPQQTSVA